jgi:23S rRNA (adenine2030-N6)-methyltransferase
LNYRHVFHAGNFADLLKHACLTAALARMTAGGAALNVIDTHAGAGVYDLDSAEAKKSGEASAGGGRLMTDPAAPAVFDPLKAEVEKLNPSGELRRYPGSPILIAGLLRPGDSFTACELRPDDFAVLKQTLNRPGMEALCADGYQAAPSRIPAGGEVLVLIDPPFERGDEYQLILACVNAVLRRNRAASVMIWLPLKDLETFDGFLRGLEALSPPRVLVAEARLRPLDDPMRMNGCALVIINDPAGLEQAAAEACDWVVRALGEAKGRARVWRL